MKKGLGKNTFEQFKSWHRGLPNPIGIPNITPKLLFIVWKQTNSTYFNAWKLWLKSIIEWNSNSNSNSSDNNYERESEKAVRNLSNALKETKNSAPNIIRSWLKPRITLFGNALLEFGRGFREGKNAPAINLDLKAFLKDDSHGSNDKQ